MLRKLQVGDSPYHGPLAPSQWNEVVESCGRWPLGSGSFCDGQISVHRPQRAVASLTPQFIPEADAVPAGGVLCEIGVTSADSPTLKAIKALSTGQRPIYVNISGADIPVGSIGDCRWDSMPVQVAYTAGDGTPAVGEIWGPAKATYLIRKGLPGFKVVAAPASGLVTCIIDQAPPVYHGKLDDILNPGDVATMSIYWWNGSAWADTTINEEVYAPPYFTSGTIAAAKWVRAEWDTQSQRLQVTAREC